jgi:superfamily II DNA or RNA helicase
MKTLFPRQEDAFSFFRTAHKNGRNTLDSSDVGTGKTVVAAHLAKEWSGEVAVICPKSVIPAWARELQAHGVNPKFVLNYEKIRTGKTPFMTKKGKKIMSWNLNPDSLILIDEVHTCKSPWTQNAQILISLVQQGFRVHAMSATAAEDPTEMRGLGFMLGLHSLNKDEAHSVNWFRWMVRYGCHKDQWGQWAFGNKQKYLSGLQEQIYRVEGGGHRLAVSDFPDSFRENRIFTEPTFFDDLAKIKKEYDLAGLTPDIITDLIERGTNTSEDDLIIVKILRARQVVEGFKIPYICEQATEHISQGKSVVIFLNFRENVKAVSQMLNCPRIEGGQCSKLRQEIIDAFQEDREHVIVANVAAGGTGVSLHDVLGSRPRVSLISPSFNAKEYAQCLGRIHRNGAKSDALQRVLVAADTIEETVMKAINKKLTNLKTLHQNNDT